MGARVTALAGGVGAAKFLCGLVKVVDPSDITIIGNPADDAIFHGMHVSPDLDIVTYWLAGIVDRKKGWGVEADTTFALEQLSRLGFETWFTLGDHDIGTHLARTALLATGLTLSEVTDRIRRALGVGSRIIPATDDRVATKITTSDGEVREFQEYFVRYRHSEEVARVEFDGIESALPAPGVLEAIEEAERIVVCPSNPVVSIGPILAVSGIREALRARRKDVYAVTPIIGGRVLKGPADRMMSVVGAEATAVGVAKLYSDFCGNFVLDRRDSELAEKIEALGVRVLPVETIMSDGESDESAAQLAKEILAW